MSGASCKAAVLLEKFNDKPRANENEAFTNTNVKLQAH